MNFRKRAEPERSGFQLAPMIDIVFLLLIFFIVTWNFARYETEIDIKVPTAKEGQDRRRAVGEIILNVKADGSVVLNRRALEREQLEGVLGEIAGLYPDQAVILRGDEGVPYKYIVDVLDVCRSVGIWNVAFATAKPQS